MNMISKSRMDEVLVVDVRSIELINILVNKIKPLQDRLNKDLAKVDDYAKTLKVENGKYINYGNCIASECDEIRNSTPWKHWKFADELDKDNLNLETADIFHFAPSVELVIDANIPYDGITPDMIDIDLIKLSNSIDDTIESIRWVLDHRDIDMELIDLVNILTHTINGLASVLSMYFSKLKYTGKLNISEIDIMKNINMEIMLITIYIHRLVFNTTLEESIDMIYSTYVVKNTLNKFRNNNGYNTGTYIKMWNGVEDNMVAVDIMSKHPEYIPETLYGALDEVYYKTVAIKETHIG